MTATVPADFAFTRKPIPVLHRGRWFYTFHEGLWYVVELTSGGYRPHCSTTRHREAHETVERLHRRDTEEGAES